MAPERGTPAGYDWEDPSDATAPDPLDLPDHAAAPQPARSGSGPDGAASRPDGAASRPGGALPPWAIVAIVVVQAAALVITVGLAIGGLQRLVGEGPAPSAASATEQEPTTEAVGQEREPGTVTDAAGRVLTDGTGHYDDPATIGDHTFTWPTWTDGTLSVTARGVDLAATLPGDGARDVVQDGYRLIAVAYEVRYEGPGQLAPVEELWLSGESDRTFFPDVAEGLVPDPVSAIGPLRSGESAPFRSVFIVPADELAGFRLGVETFGGEVLYFAAA